MRVCTTRNVMCLRRATTTVIEHAKALQSKNSMAGPVFTSNAQSNSSKRFGAAYATTIERQYTMCLSQSGRPIGFSRGGNACSSWSTTDTFVSHKFPQRRNFCALTPQEEEEEKQRVANLTDYQKEIEKRKLDAEIKRLQMLRGINTGELYTWRGKLKNLALEYGVGFTLWWYTTWTVMCGMCFVGIEYGNVDALAIIAKTDAYTGFDLAKKIDPTFGTAAVAVAFNEMLEPIRLVFVVSTTKPVVEFFRRNR